MRIGRAALFALLPCQISSAQEPQALIQNKECFAGDGEKQVVGNNTTPTAQQISNDFRDFFETGIRDYDARPSTDASFQDISTVVLWHKAIAKLDIPDEDDPDASDFVKLRRLLSSVMIEIGDAAFPDPSSPDDPNHDWKGRAGKGNWARKKNRANHDALNQMRQGATALHFVHQVKLHRPDVWRRVLRAREVEPESDDERLYLYNVFVAAYIFNILRYGERNALLYEFSDDARVRILRQVFSSEGNVPELKTARGAVVVASAWLLHNLGQTNYYKSLLGRHLDQMVKASMAINPVYGKFQDENGETCKQANVLFHDDEGRKYKIDTMSDDVLAAHFENGVLWLGHFVDHVRINYSHYTKPKGCDGLFVFVLYETLFGGDAAQRRVQESYSFWTYLTQQAGIVSSEGGEVAFTQMKGPDEIRLEMGKTFFESNPWAGGNKGSISRIWKHLTKYPPSDKAQKKFHALCKDFDLFLELFFGKEHLRRNLLGADTANFFQDLFPL